MSGSSPHFKATTAGKYVLGGTKMSLKLLESVFGFIPIPYVQVALNAACQVINVAESVKANREDIATLNGRVSAITLVAVAPFKDNAKANPAQLDRLSIDLKAIEYDLAKLQKHGNSAVFLINKLDWAMQLFQVKSQIADAVKLLEVAQSVQAIRDDTQLIREDTQVIRDDVGELRRLAESTSLPALPTTALPPPPEIFFGRGHIVKDIVHRILSYEPVRLALLGPDGIGKTSVASAIANEPELVIRFGARRFWVPCDQATSVSLLIALLAQACKVVQSSPDRLQDVLSALKVDDQPRLVIFDNFETPWDIEGQQSEITDVLCHVTAISHVAVIFTMRGVLLAPTRIKWSKPALPPLDVLLPEAARELFDEICPGASGDEALLELLKALDYMPLAVTLMAKVGRDDDECPKALLARWRSDGPDVIHEPGADRRTSVNTSIEFSLRSKSMGDNPDALLLLSVLSALPGGARRGTFQNLIPNIQNPSAARAALVRASLIYSKPEQQSLHVLAPVSSYVTRHHPLSSQSWEAVYAFYFALVNQYDYESYSTNWTKAFAALTGEETNLEFVILHALQNGLPDPALEAALQFSWYQHRTYPRLEVITAATEIARGQRDRTCYAHALKCMGNMEYKLCKYDEARMSLGKGLNEFQRLGNPREAAQCLRSLGTIDYAQARFDESRRAVQDSRVEFLRLGDAWGATRCLYTLGKLDHVQGRDDEGRAALQDAQAEFLRLGDTNGAVRCLRSLGTIAYTQDRIDEALATLRDAQAEFQQLGDSSGAAYSLQRLGAIDCSQGRYNEAQAAQLDARAEFRRLGDTSGAARCSLSLGNISYLQDRHDEARVFLKDARAEFQRLDDPLGAAQCLQCLGNIDTMQGRYEKAQIAMREAAEVFQRLGNPSRAVYGLRMSPESFGDRTRMSRGQGRRASGCD